MKTLKNLILIIITLNLVSCEKVIELKFDNTDPKIVIQGNVYNRPGPYKVIISRSVDFDEPNNFPAVTGATVIIKDDAGNTETLTETESGTYVTSTMVGTPGRTYNLIVTTDGITYLATSKMPQEVNIEAMFLDKDFFGNENIIAVKFMDPTPVKNYYNLILFINNNRQNLFYTINDEPYEGKAIECFLMPEDMQYEFQTDDEVKVWLESIDKGVYDYFMTAEYQSSSSESPSNPVSNINNGALGYFNACAVHQSSFVVQ